MPIYSYKCEKCDHEFEKLLSISNLNKPNEEPCPVCSAEKSVIRTISLSTIVSGVSLSDKRPDGFRDVLKHIQKSHPNGNINA